MDAKIKDDRHTNFNVISLGFLIKYLMATIDKKEFVAILNKYMGRGLFVGLDGQNLLFGHKKRTPQTIADEKEDILNLLELNPEFKLTTMQQKWLNDWQPSQTEPEPQREPEPQQGSLEYYCEKGVEKGYLRKEDNGYRKICWSKAQLAYFLRHFPNSDGTFPDNKYCKMFGESRLSKAADQLCMNKDGKPRGYKIIDELLQE